MGMISNPGGAASPSTKEFFVKWPAWLLSGGPAATNRGNFPVVDIDGSTQSIKFGFFVPNDFVTLVDAVLSVIPNASATHRLNLSSEYGNDGENFDLHTESEADKDTVLVSGKNSKIDLSGVLTGIMANDFVSVSIVGDATNTANLDIRGFRFRYS